MSTKSTRFFGPTPITIFNGELLDMLTAIDQRFGTEFAPIYWEPFRGNKMLAGPATTSNVVAASARNNYRTESDDISYREFNNDDGKIWVHGTYPKLRILRDSSPEDGTLESIRILVAVPGVDKDDIVVYMEGSKITIELKPEPVSQEEKAEKKSLPILNEIPQGKNRVEIGMNGPFDVENSKAEFKENGMLEIIVPALKQKKRVNILGK